MLHPIEQKVLAALKARSESGRPEVAFDALVKDTELLTDQVRRALEWLKSKGYVDQIETTVETPKLIKAGTTQEPLDLVLARRLKESGGSLSLNELKKAFSNDQEISAAFGRARKSSSIKLEKKGGRTTVTLVDTERVDKLEQLLKLIGDGVYESTVPPPLLPMVPELIKSGIARRIEDKYVAVRITDLGKQNVSSVQEVGYIDALSPELITTGRWKGLKLRPINVEAGAPRFFPGRRHPVHDFIKEVREAYISMGFTEVEGSNIQPSFWNFDALFIPQNHPGREMQDTFYIKGFTDRKLKRVGAVAQVASVHENGWVTGSKGWGYAWDVEEARRLVLRTHNTSVTAQSLAKTVETETRAFAVGKVYRNENLDYKHLAEFHQMDGIIVGDGMTARHLMGFLLEFYEKLGFKVKIWPSYFPYTEPSLQAVFYSETSERWLELGGSGVFRPEVTWPLGVRKPVLAWGLGIERLILLRSGLDDLRVLYENDLGWLRGRAEIASSEAVQR